MQRNSTVRKADEAVTMEWTYRIKAEVRPRVLMRVAHVFDQQMLSMRRCLMVETAEFLELEITAEAEQELAQRVHAKLYKLLDLLQIDLLPGRPPSTGGSLPGEIGTIQGTNGKVAL